MRRELMKNRAARQGKDWTDVAVAMDRSLRVFADFAKPILAAHSADNLSLSNLLFLISINGEAKVNDLVKSGRYLGSNASYALKALQGSGFIDRRQDETDRRNAVVSWTERGLLLVTDLKAACSASGVSAGRATEAARLLENHCARLPDQK